MSKIKLFTLFLVLALCNRSNAQFKSSNLLCYLDSTSFIREGFGKFTMDDLELAIEHCTHLIYGYAGIDTVSFKIKSIHPDLDLDEGKGQFQMITSLKKKFPHLKVLLGVGGDSDASEEGNKYLNLLESNTGRISFVNSAHSLLLNYGFDGIDLAWQFPKNKKKINNVFKKAWKSFKSYFTGDCVVDKNAAEHKEQFTELIHEFKTAFNSENLILGISVLPNVNSSYFFDIPSLKNNIDMVNLFAFDFNTPERNEKKADYPAPIYGLDDRDPEANVNFQVQYWLNEHIPAGKINVVAPAYGRSWVMSKHSGLTGHPPVDCSKGAGEAGLQSLNPGLLSWPEICAKLPNPSNVHLKGPDAPLRKVPDPTKRFGPYALRSADDKGENGIWVGYEDPDSIGNKASYVRSKGLGGFALFELSLDDYSGSCAGGKYPLLRAAKFKL